MKRWMKWIILAAIAAALLLGIARALSSKKAQQTALETSTATARAMSTIELAPTDLVKAQTRLMVQGLPISGALKAANTALVKARANGELRGLTVREGDAVQAGQVLAQIDATEAQARVRQAEQSASAAKAQVDVAQRQFDNNNALVNQGFISKTALDTSIANLNAARANYQAAQANADVARKGLADTVVKAPISGQISQRMAQPGERVSIEARIVEIVDVSKLELEAALSPADSVGVRVGNPAVLHVEGFAQPLQAQVVRINPAAQAGSRSVLVYLSVAPRPGLRQGLFVQGALGVASGQLLSVPVDALRTDKPQPYIQVVENGRVAHKPVTPSARGETDGQPMVAISGVTEGAVVLAGSVGPQLEGTGVKFTATPTSANGSPPAAGAVSPAQAAHSSNNPTGK